MKQKRNRIAHWAMILAIVLMALSPLAALACHAQVGANCDQGGILVSGNGSDRYHVRAWLDGGLVLDRLNVPNGAQIVFNWESDFPQLDVTVRHSFSAQLVGFDAPQTVYFGGPECGEPAVCQTLTATPNTIFLGQSTILSVSALGAVAFRFDIDGHQGAEQATNTITYTPTTAGDHQVEAFVKGTDGQWHSACTCRVTVHVRVPQYNVNVAGTCDQITVQGHADTNGLVQVTGTDASGASVNLSQAVTTGDFSLTFPRLNPGTYGPHPVALHGDISVDGAVKASDDFSGSLTCGPIISGYICEAEAGFSGDPDGWDRERTTLKDGSVLTGPESELLSVTAQWFRNGKPFASTSANHYPDGLWHSISSLTDIGWGRFTVNITVTGPRGSANCSASFVVVDHDNVVIDPGPYGFEPPALDKFEHIFTTPSRLPQVGRVPLDEGNWPDSVSGFLWGLETEGHGPSIKVVHIMNGGRPLARPSLTEISNELKFDGLEAGNGRCYIAQLGEHGPISPVWCPQADGQPVTGYVRWGAGGQTWLDLDGASAKSNNVAALYGDGWWLSVTLAQQGVIVLNEKVATCLAKSPTIRYEGHSVLRFNTVQDMTNGLGPRVQDIIVGLKGTEWQGEIWPAQMPVGCSK